MNTADFFNIPQISSGFFQLKNFDYRTPAELRVTTSTSGLHYNLQPIFAWIQPEMLSEHANNIFPTTAT